MVETPPAVETPEPQPARPRGLWPREGVKAPPQPSLDDAPFTAEEANRWKLPRMDNWLAVRVLSQAESKQIRDDLRAGIRRYGKRADEWITATTRDGTAAHIWARLPDDDLETLVDVWLEYGKVNRIIAQTARGFARTNKLMDAGLILGAKAMETQQHYLLHGFEAMGLGALMGQMIVNAQHIATEKASAS